MRKAQIWISAVLYIALGIIVIALILAASIPLIDKIKDRNTVTETKNLLLTIDETIRIVSKEGPGSQRELSPITINKGRLFIHPETDIILWNLKTSAIILEPDTPIEEGVLSLLHKTTQVKNEYLMTITLDYTDHIDLELESDYQPPFTGHYSALILHNGNFTTTSLGEEIPVIKIKIL